MGFLIFLLVTFGVLGLAFGYAGWRLIIPAQLSYPWNLLAWGVLAALLIMPFLPFLARILGWPFLRGTAFAWIGYLGLGFFSLLFTVLIFRDLGWMVLTGVQKFSSLIRDVIGSGGGASESWEPERRQFLINSINLGIMGIAGTLAAYGLYRARHRPKIVEISVPIRYLPGELEGFRIVQITDIHAGLTVRRKFVQTVVDEAGRLAPDVIVFTGDLVDGSVAELREDVAPMAALSAPHGKFFITGNHEYYSGAQPWVNEAERLGFTVLLNENRVLTVGKRRILMAGVTDYSGGEFIPSHASNPEAALSGGPPCDVKILLAHQPRSILDAAPYEFDLQISGHTHGGQFFPWNFVAGLAQPYLAGLHQFDPDKGRWIYVSRGTGYWGPPIRIGAPSEITVIKLVREKS